MNLDLDILPHVSLATTIAHMAIAAAIGVRVIMKRPAIGIALSWLLLIVTLPGVGAVAYLLIGERRINAGRARRLREFQTDYDQIFQAAVREGLTDVDWSRHEPIARALDALARRTVGTATLRGSSFQLFSDTLVVPTGPEQTKDGLLQMILAVINAARGELTLTTPYLVPDESLLRALRGAAGRGVKVALIVPEKVDSFLTRNASRSYYDDLLEVGVEIHLFRGGLLHTKSITADGHLLMFGTANLDMRSLWLNYEVSLFASDRPLAEAIRELQAAYIADSVPLDVAAWSRRSRNQRLLENSLRLLSPLL